MKSLPRTSVLSSRSLFDFLWLALLAAYIVGGITLVPFHGDESTILYMSRDYGYQFLQRDLDLVRYRDDSPSPPEQYLRLVNGSVSKYVYGLAWHLAGYTLADVNEQWDWGADWNYNATTHRIPSDGMLMAARVGSSTMLVASVVMLFALGKQIGGRPVAYLATLYFVLNPAILLNGRRAVFESAMLLGELLVIGTAILFLRRWTWQTALLFGAACGFALASKHTNLVVIGAAGLVCLLYPVFNRREIRLRPVRAGGLLFLAGIAAALVFYFLNPVWWGANVPYQLQLILRLRRELLEGQTAAFGGYANPLEQLAGFFQQVFIATPQYYEVPSFAAWLADPIARYESSFWRGVSLGGSLVGGLVLVGLTLIGIWTFAKTRAIPASARAIVLLWAAALLLATYLLTPVDWQRYYVPVYPVVALLASFGLVRLVQRFRKP